MNKTKVVKVMAEDEECKAWEVAAAIDGRSLSGWARKACAEKLARDRGDDYKRGLVEGRNLERYGGTMGEEIEVDLAEADALSKGGK